MKKKIKKKVAKKVAKKKSAILKKKKVLPLIPEKPKDEEKLSTDITVLEEAFEGDHNLVLFFLAWIRNGRNATKAYQKIHPKVNNNVASVLGARRLAKVKNLGGIEMLLEVYGIGVDKYFSQLKQGIEAMDRVEIKHLDGDGNEISEIREEPNHKVRRHYHRALGKLLGFEDSSATVQINNTNQNQNNNQNIIDNINDDELDDLIS